MYCSVLVLLQEQLFVFSKVVSLKKKDYTLTIRWNIFLKTSQVVNDRIFFSRILSCGIITPMDFLFNMQIGRRFGMNT